MMDKNQPTAIERMAAGYEAAAAEYDKCVHIATRTMAPAVLRAHKQKCTDLSAKKRDAYEALQKALKQKS